MKRRTLVLSLLIALAASLMAQTADPATGMLPPYPGKVWYTLTGAQVGWLFNLSANDGESEYDTGNEMFLQFAIEDLFGLKGLESGLYGFYRYDGAAGDDLWLNPGFGAYAGYRFDLFNTFSLRANLGADIYNGRLFSPGELTGSVKAPDAEWNAGLRASLGLSARILQNVSIQTDFQLLAPLTETRPLMANLGIGIRFYLPHWIEIPQSIPSLTVSSSMFSADSDGQDDYLDIGLASTNPQSIKKWDLVISDTNDRIRRSYSGTGIPPASLHWYGLDDTGTPVESASDYNLAFTVWDDMGRTSKIKTAIKTDVLVFREGQTYRIRISKFIFQDNPNKLGTQESAKYFLENNRMLLERLSQILSKYPGYSISIEAHTNTLNWENPKEFQALQKKELLPQTLGQANEIREALVLLQIDRERLSSKGIGASVPMVPFDAPDSWRNSRVEFILQKPAH